MVGVGGLRVEGRVWNELGGGGGEGIRKGMVACSCKMLCYLVLTYISVP